jgi:glycosyltransferase involved in cell wall biosynthesis
MSAEVPDYIRALQELVNKGSSSSESATAVPVPAAVQMPQEGAASIRTLEVSEESKKPNEMPFINVAAVKQEEVKEVSATLGSGEKLRFMLVSTHCQQFTGYSKVSYGILQELSKLPWVEVIHFGFQKAAGNVPPTYRPYPPNITVYDAAANERPAQPGQQPNQGFGFAQLPEMIRAKKPHVVLIYNDMSVINRFMEEIRRSGIPRTFKTWLYVDQVYTTQLQGYIDVINRDADRVFAFTSFWKQCLKDQGVTRPIDILMHGFDKEMFKVVPKAMARNQMKLPTDAFIYICLNRNQPRKRYDLLIMAFVELIVKNPTKPLFLMCICDKGEKGGWPLFEIFSRELKLRGASIENYGNRLMISASDMTFRDEDINMFYNVADVGVSAAEGEGWGLCNFEQMGVGVPQIVPDLGGFKEFCNKENSMVVPADGRYYLPLVYAQIGGEAFQIDPHKLALAMEEYAMNTKLRKEHGIKARETVLKYTWERATEQLVRRLRRTKEDLENGDD